MTDATWAPLSRRVAGLGPDRTVHEGVPPYMVGVLRNWAYGIFSEAYRYSGGSDLSDMIEFRLRRESLNLSESSVDELLDVIDALLSWWLSSESDEIDALEEILTTGGAGWRVNADRKGLERRVDVTVTAAVIETVHTTRDEAAEHLAAAWSATYGRHPDPDKAYSHAVLAVEAVSCPLVAPRSDRATLGSVIRDLNNQSDQWELVLADRSGQPAKISGAIDMLNLLWRGQSRHAGSSNSRRQTQAEAEAAVHLAAVLVQWLSSGVLRRKS